MSAAYEIESDFVRLHPDDIVAIAQQLKALMADENPQTHMTAEEVAERYGVKVGWVYEHKRELGAIPMGDGKRPRLRFPLKSCDEFMAGRGESGPRRQKRSKRRAKGHTASGLPLLPIPDRIIPR